jgi:hypothetical protein
LHFYNERLLDMLEHFNLALVRYRDEIGYNKFWRWTEGGQSPSLLRWLLEKPDLIAALEADAKALAQSQNDTTERATHSGAHV